jgi:hypothetical protein
MVKPTKKLLRITNNGAEKYKLAYKDYPGGVQITKTYTIDEVINKYKEGHPWPVRLFLVKDSEQGAGIESHGIKHFYDCLWSTLQHAFCWGHDEYIKDFVEWSKE